MRPRKDTGGNRWQSARLSTAAILAGVLSCQFNSPVAAQQATVERDSEVRSVIVSHTDQTNTLQLYFTNDDGTSKRQITNGKHSCLQPAWSPDGKKVVYVQQSNRGMALLLTDPEGKATKALTEPGNHLLPSWLPDSKHIVWMLVKGGPDPSSNSELRIMNTETMESRRLFSDPAQITFSNSMPAVSPQGDRVAFVSNRSGDYRIWVSRLDGSQAAPISTVTNEYNKTIGAPIEQKVPTWSPDGKWIAHWEGVEMTELSRFTGKQDQKRDQLIAASWHVWVVGSDGKNKRRVGPGDDPTWSPDGFVTRSFPDPKKGGPTIMIETRTGSRELPIVPANSNYGRFTWKP